MAALRKRVATLTNKPVIHQTATSKARAEFVKSSASTSSGQGFSIKQPLKPGRQHHGIPIILSHQKKTNNESASTEPAKAKKPLVANPAQLRVSPYFENQFN